MPLDVQNLGQRVSYTEALALQEELVSKRRDEEIMDTLLLLEHAPVYTIGRTRDQSSLQNASHLPHEVHEVSRGGQATFHGPGQLVGYAIIDLQPYGRDLHRYLRALELSLQRFCESHSVMAEQREGFTGLWVGPRKLASIGVGVRKWVTYHGFGLNLRPEALPPFQAITPCGLNGVQMTCLANEMDTSKKLTLEDCVADYPAYLETALLELE